MDEPKAKLLARIADALGIPVSDFAGPDFASNATFVQAVMALVQAYHATRDPQERSRCLQTVLEELARLEAPNRGKL